MQKSKLLKSSFFVIGIIVFGLIFLRISASKYKDRHCLITQLSSKLFDLNDVKINVSENLSIDDFKIENINSGRIIYENGEFKKGIKNEYGFCLFNVYYKDSLLIEIGHEKRNNWHTNDYLFVFEKISDTINSTLIITGPDSDHGNLFYKKFERNEFGLVSKVIYSNRDKKIYNEELVKK
jgi:hypothetical protein